MAELRALCAALGWEDARTYIQSGNIVFKGAGPAADLEAALEAGIGKRCGFAVPVIIRSAAQWATLIAANPFPGESEREPNRVMMVLAKAAIAPGADAMLAGRARAGERIAVAGGAIWGHFPAGLGTSRLSPELFNKAAGSPATGRNWRTVLILRDMLAAAAAKGSAAASAARRGGG